MNQNTNMLEKLKVKWGIDSNWGVMAVLITFTLSGSTVVFIRPYLFSSLGFDANTSIIIKSMVYLICIFPLYQVLLLLYGSLFGQGQFFWIKEKKLMMWLYEKLFKKEKNKTV
jgi:hypothetical protein